MLLPFRHRVIKILKGTWALVLSVQGSKIIEGSFCFLSGRLPQEGNCTACQRLRLFLPGAFLCNLEGGVGSHSPRPLSPRVAYIFYHPALGRCLCGLGFEGPVHRIHFLGELTWQGTEFSLALPKLHYTYIHIFHYIIL